MDTGTLNNIIGITIGCVGLSATIWGLRRFIEHRLVEPQDTRFADAIESQSTYKLYHYFVKELHLEPLTRFVGDRDTGPVLVRALV